MNDKSAHAGSVQLDDALTDSSLFKYLPIDKEHMGRAEERIALYRSLSADASGQAMTNKAKARKKQLLLKYLTLRLLSQQVRQADNVISAFTDSQADLGSSQKQRIYAIDPHIMLAYADCLNSEYVGYSILKLFHNEESVKEERIALLALLNDSIKNDNTQYLLLGSGLKELSAHSSYLVQEEHDDENDKSIFKDEVLAAIKDDSYVQQLKQSLDQLEDDSLRKMAYSVFPTVLKSSAVARMRELVKFNEGHFHSFERHPRFMSMDSNKRKIFYAKLQQLKDSRCYFEVQREFRNIYKKFLSVVYTTDKTASAREYDNIDALFEVHCSNTILNQLELPLEICYLSFSPRVTTFANLFLAGAMQVSVIHPRFLPIYLACERAVPKQADWTKANDNINAILRASSFTREDLLHTGDAGRYTLDEKKLNACYAKVQKPLAAIEGLYNVTSGTEDLDDMFSNIISDLKSGGFADEIIRLSGNANGFAGVTEESLLASFKTLICKWRDHAYQFSNQVKEDLVEKTVQRQMDILQAQSIEFAPVVVRKIVKNNDLKYVVFLPTLGAARYAFSIPFVEGENWVKQLQLSHSEDKGKYYSIGDVLNVFGQFLKKYNDEEKYRNGRNYHRIEITKRLIGGLLCIATYHWSLAKTLFVEGKKLSFNALNDDNCEEKAPIRLLQQECLFFYQIAERGNIEQNYVGNRLAQQLLNSYGTIQETTTSFIDFYHQSWPADARADNIIHPMSARLSISAIMLMLELLSSQRAMELISNNAAQFSNRSLLGIDCIKAGQTPLLDELTGLSILEAIKSPATALEQCRKACIRLSELLQAELNSLLSAADVKNSKILLQNRKMRFLQTAVIIDFMQQLGFYAFLHADPELGVDQFGANPCQTDESWDERLNVFNRYKSVYLEIKSNIEAHNANLEAHHRLSEILCLLGDILYEPDSKVKSFRRLLNHELVVASGEDRAAPFPTDFVGSLLSRLNQVDSNCRKMQSSGFPRTFARTMKLIIAIKVEQFVRMVANGVKHKYLEPYGK